MADGYIHSRRMISMAHRRFLTLLVTLALASATRVNIALNKTAIQSSTYEYKKYMWHAQYAVDGVRDYVSDVCQCCSGTHSTPGWWELDLGDVYNIGRIDVYGRLSRPDQTWGFKLYVSVTTNATANGEEVYYNNVTLETFKRNDGHFSILIGETHAQFVAVYLPWYMGMGGAEQPSWYTKTSTRTNSPPLVICEMEVYPSCAPYQFEPDCATCHCEGEPCDRKTGICPSGNCLPGWIGQSCSQEKNVALRKRVTGSSQFHDWSLARAVDGSSSNETVPSRCGCCTATSGKTSTNWIKVDLGRLYLIGRIVIYGRTDHKPNHFQHVSIKVINQEFNDYSLLHTIPDVTIDVNFTLTSPRVVRYVSLDQDPRRIAEPFVVCELQVFPAECGAGTYGEFCEHRCFCSGDPCNIINGVCPSGKCEPGYHTDTCSQPCPPYYYGNCKSGCGLCRNTVSCNRTTGSCPDGCDPGYTTDTCLEVCGHGRYGDGCQETCGKCKHGATCNHINGTCENGCSPGYLGINCTQECSYGTFGENCGGVCHCADNNVCDVGTGHCPDDRCAAGYEGSSCDKICNEGNYGNNCLDTCGRCKYNAACQPMTGKCYDGCDPGYQGDWCSEACTAGHYGANCEGRCGSCKHNASCHHVSGTCSNGCDPGYQGDRCDKTCTAGHYGANCEERCGSCKHNASCHHVSGNCSNGCDPGYQRERCDKMCSAGHYGANCAGRCGSCKHNASCHHVSGNCGNGCDPGYQGDRCDKMCTAGLYGANCEERCGSCKHNASCHHVSGTCGNGCDPGYQGDRCTEMCPEGNYGDNCHDTCGWCKHNTSCHYVTGKCDGGCNPGYQGDRCSEACTTGNYGANCEKRCGSCKHSASCHHETGNCDNGCDPGYQGDRCAEKCKGSYGANCQNTCGSCKDKVACNHVTGNCTYGCDPGYQGYGCAEKMIAITQSPPVSTTTIAAIVVPLLIVLILIVILGVVWRRRRGQKSSSGSNTATEGGFTDMQTDNSRTTGQANIALEQDKHQTNGNVPTALKKCPDDNDYYSFSVNVNALKVHQLWTYIKTKMEDDCKQFFDEFGTLQRGLLYSHDVALMPANRPKNRYRDMYAYDHSRVPLTTSHEGDSEYINACFIDGYERVRKFIASQGPTKAMLDDFWRMIWQQKSQKVVMLTNLVEQGTQKCLQYWPDSGTTSFGHISVDLKKEETFTDYTVRHLQICQDNESPQLVTQYHFRAWPDKDVPNDAWTLVNFWRHVMEDPTSGGDEKVAPIVVHCSAGIGRTGTFIALDNLFQQAQAEGCVRPLQMVETLRRQRVTMVQTREQYVYLHEAMAEALLFGTHFVWSKQFEDVHQFMKETDEKSSTSRIESQYKLMEKHWSETKSKEAEEATDDNSEYINLANERGLVQSKYALDIHLLPSCDGTDGFLVTSSPNTNTIATFLCEVEKRGVCCIVMMTDESAENYEICRCLGSKDSKQTNKLSVNLNEETRNDSYAEKTFTLTNSGDNSTRTLKQFEYTSWPRNMTPSDTQSILRLIEAIQNCQKGTAAPVLMHCGDDYSRSGLVCVLLNEINRINSHGDRINIVESVMSMRQAGVKVIPTAVQYQYCYDVILDHLKQPDVYQNL